MSVDWVSGRLGLALKIALMLIEQALRSVRKVPTLLDALLKFGLRFLDLTEPPLRLRLTIHTTPPDTPKVQQGAIDAQGCLWLHAFASSCQALRRAPLRPPPAGNPRASGWSRSAQSDRGTAGKTPARRIGSRILQSKSFLIPQSTRSGGTSTSLRGSALPHPGDLSPFGPALDQRRQGDLRAGPALLGVASDVGSLGFDAR